MTNNDELNVGVEERYTAAKNIERQHHSISCLSCGSCLGILCSGNCRVHFLAIFPPDTWGRSAVAAALA
jgi:hypothetical protein